MKILSTRCPHPKAMILTLSTMKSMASAIIGSTGPDEKFPRTIFLSINDGISQKLLKKKKKRPDNLNFQDYT